MQTQSPVIDLDKFNKEPVELGSTAILNFEPLQKYYNIVLFVSAFKTNSFEYM